MQNAATEQLQFRNPFLGLVENSAANAQNPQQGTENRDPLPNPWSPSGTQQGTTTESGSQPRSPTTPNVQNNPQMSNLLQQMSDNPSFIQNMLSAPYTQTMMEAMAADPELANQIISQNPLLRGNPALQQQMRTMMPQVLQQLRNPVIQNLVTNPQALNALLQVQQGMETLRQTAPNVLNSLGVPPPNPNATPTNASTDSSATPNPNPLSQDGFSEV